MERMDNYSPSFRSSDHRIENFCGCTGVERGRSAPVVIIQNFRSFKFPVSEQGELEFEPDEEGQLVGESFSTKNVGTM